MEIRALFIDSVPIPCDNQTKAGRSVQEAVSMAIATEGLIRDMVAIVAREVEPQAIILFGSHATGDARHDSDVDLMVIESTPFGPGRDRRREMTRLWHALAGFAVAKDILVYSREEVERWRDARNHVIARALREGRLLYGSI